MPETNKSRNLRNQKDRKNAKNPKKPKDLKHVPKKLREFQKIRENECKSEKIQKNTRENIQVVNCSIDPITILPYCTLRK